MCVTRQVEVNGEKCGAETPNINGGVLINRLRYITIKMHHRTAVSDAAYTMYTIKRRWSIASSAASWRTSRKHQLAGVQSDRRCRRSGVSYRCLIGTAPSCLAETLHLTADVGSRRRLRGASTSTLVIPSTRRTTLGGGD